MAGERWSWRSPVWQAGVLGGLAYFAIAFLIVSHGRQSANIASIWYPNAVGIALLALRERREWPWILVSLSLANYLVSALMGDPMRLSLAFLPVNLIHMSLVAWLLQRDNPAEPPISDPKRLAITFLRAGLLPVMGCALIAGLLFWSLSLGGLIKVAETWFQSRIVGTLSVLPLILIVLYRGPRGLAPIAERTSLGLLCLVVAVALVGPHYLDHPFVFITLPLIAIAARGRFASTAMALVLASIGLGLVLGNGVLAPADRFVPVHQTTYLSILAALLPALFLAATTESLGVALERLGRSEERYRTYYENTPSMLHTHDHLGRIVSVSQFWLSKTGYTTDQVTGRMLSEFYERLDGGPLEHDRAYVGFPARLRATDGRVFDVEVSAVPEVSADGAEVQYLTVSDDVTDREQARRALVEAHQFYQQIFDNMPVLVAYWDAQQHCRFCNLAYLSWFGIRPDDIVGKSMIDLLGPKLYEKNRPHIEAALAGQTQRFDRAVPSVGGRVRFTQASYVPDVGPQGVRGFYAFITDISERKRLEDALRELNADLETRVATRTRELSVSMAELEGLAYTLAHDLRAPARHVSVFSSKIREGMPDNLPDQIRKWLRMIEESAGRQATLIEDILTYLKLGVQELVRLPVDVTAMVRELIAELDQEGAINHAIAWQVDEGMRVDADATLLRRIFYNLLSNAAKFSLADGQARVHIGCEMGPDDRPQFFVRDNGIGFDAHLGSRIFNLFVRVHGDAKLPGNGVGLAIVKRLVQMHGGVIEAESSLGQGASFRFTLTPAPEASN